MLIAVVVLSLGFIAHSATQNKTKTQSGYYLLSEKVFQLLEKKKKEKKTFFKSVRAIQRADGFVLTSMSDYELSKLSHDIHQELGTCGGFFDVSHEYEKTGFTSLDFSDYKDAKESPHLVDLFKDRQIKNLEIVKNQLKLVQKSRFESSLQQFTQFPNRSSRSENGKKAAEWLYNKAKDYARAAGRDDISVEYIETGRRYVQDSVVIKIPGKSTFGSGVLIGGHMDTLTWGNNLPGADDDASGTISTLEVFRAVVDSQMKFQNDIYFAFYAAEEVGLVGSGRMAEVFKQRGTPLQAVFHLDMTGYLSSSETNELYFITDYTTSSLNEWTKNLAVKVLEIPARKIQKTSCGYACSDHASWKRKGYNTVFPFESSFDNHNRSIHSSRDTVNLINIDHAMKFVKLGFAFVVELGEPINN